MNGTPLIVLLQVAAHRCATNDIPSGWRFRVCAANFGSILFEDRDEHNELCITLSRTAVTDRPLLNSALTRACLLSTWNTVVNPTCGVSDMIGHTESVNERARNVPSIHSS
jgi:hypothetical protein